MTLTLETLLALLGALIALAGFWWGIARWVLSEFAKRDLKIEAEHARAKMAEEEVRSNLQEHKLYAAEHFATKDGVTQALDRVEAAVERLTQQVHDVVERLTDRLDRYLEKRGE